jgi:hypothetical protein
VLDRWVTRECGVVVTGPDPRELIDPIGPGELRAAVLASMLGPPWAALVDRALGWRADERVDDDSLAGTLELVGHAVELARSRGPG